MGLDLVEFAIAKGDDRTWTRAEIEGVVRALMIEELGISSFRWTDRFVKDLGCG